MKGEIWKDIEGYEGLYQVSNMGNVKSLNYKRTGKEGILKPGKVSSGYLQVQLHQDGKRKKYYVHQLVATAFCENQMGYTEVNHLDEDKTNNRADNLEFCSSSYNCNYGTRIKRIAEKLRNDPKRSKPLFGIDKITGLIVEFASAHEASRQLGISNGNICDCLKGRKKSVGGFYWYYANVNNNDAE